MNTIEHVESALRDRNKKAINELVDIYCNKKKLKKELAKVNNPMDKLLINAGLYDKYSRKFSDNGYDSLDTLAFYFDNIVKKLKINQKDKIKLLKAIRKHKNKFNKKYINKFSGSIDNTLQLSLDEYIEQLKYKETTRIHNIKTLNKSILNKKVYESSEISYNESKKIKDIITINDGDKILISSKYDDIMSEHRKLSGEFLLKLLIQDTSDRPDISAGGIMLSLYLYTLNSQYKNIKQQLFENHQKYLNIYFLKQNNDILLKRPLKNYLLIVKVIQ